MAKIKFIQVNIYKGKYLEALVDFLKKEDPDFVTMQEVSAGKLNFNEDKSLNTFETIRDRTGLEGVFYSDLALTGDPQAQHGNAILSRYPIVESSKVPLREHEPFTDEEFNNSNLFPVFPRSIVDATVDFAGTMIHILSVHGAWTAPPADTPEALRQAQIIKEHLQGLQTPFLAGADMNTTAEMMVIKTIEEAAVNLMKDSGIEYTTHPTMHKIAPRKLAVDYIFASADIKRISIEAPVVVVSDHLPVVAELEF